MSTKDGATYPAPNKPAPKPTKTPKPVVVEEEANASDS